MYNAHVITHLRRLQALARINSQWGVLPKVQKKLIQELDDALNLRYW